MSSSDDAVTAHGTHGGETSKRLAVSETRSGLPSTRSSGRRSQPARLDDEHLAAFT